MESIKSEPVEIHGVEPDLIDRIAGALPEELRADYYRELRHCRSLPENDEMLRLLRAMQFLVLLIEQAPTRVAEERERLDHLLASAVASVGRMNSVSETWHAALDQRLKELPADIADGISPEAVARQINESLRQEFLRSTIPQTAADLAGLSERMKNVCSEFATTSGDIGYAYRGAAEDTRKAIAALNEEVSRAAQSAGRFTREVAQKCSSAWRWAQFLIAAGSLVIGLALGMVFERWLFFAAQTVAPAATSVQAAPLSVPPPAPPLAKKTVRKAKTQPRSESDGDLTPDR